MGRLPRLPITIFERPGSSVTRAWPATTSPTATWRPTANSVRTISSVNTMPLQSLAWNAATQPSPTHCAQSPKSPLAAGGATDTDAKVLKANLSLDRNGPYKVLVVGPCTPADTPDGSPLGAKVLYSDLPSGMPGEDAHRRASVQRCKPCSNRHDHADMPKYFPAGLTQYVFNNFYKKFLPDHVTQHDVSTPLQRLEVEKITRHQSVRGRGGVIAVMYETHWTGLSRPSWAREMELQISRRDILRYSAGTPNKHRQTRRLYCRMRISAARRELSRINGERFLAPGYGCVPHAEWLTRYSVTVLPNGAHVWYRGDDGFVVAWEDQREHDYEWDIFVVLFW